MEYCESDLSRILEAKRKFSGHLEESLIITMLRDVSAALMALHEKRMVHMDIRPGRLRFTRKHISYKIEEEILRNICFS